MKYRLKIALLSAGVLLGYGFGFHHLATGKHCHRGHAAERCAAESDGDAESDGAAPTPRSPTERLPAGFGAAAPIQ